MAESNKDQNIIFNIEKVYIKDISYETPNVPEVFIQKGTPQANVQFAIRHTTLDQDKGLYEVEMIVTVTASISDQNAFLVEVKQAGIFRITGIGEDEMPMVLGIGCPNVLLPFAREVVNDLVTKGGFPQLMLAPVNFEALYEQKHSAQKQEA